MKSTCLFLALAMSAIAICGCASTEENEPQSTVQPRLPADYGVIDCWNGTLVFKISDCPAIPSPELDFGISCGDYSNVPDRRQCPIMCPGGFKHYPKAPEYDTKCPEVISELDR